jgi:capsular polysaccharide biosynthesis protein
VKNSRTFFYEDLETYAASQHSEPIQISKPIQIPFKSPRFLFTEKQTFIESHLTLVSRGVDYQIFQNVEVFGRSEILRIDDRIILPSGYSPTRDVLPIELDGEISFDLVNKTIKVMNRDTTQSIDEAIHLLGSLTGNYAHWVLEFLPKFIAFAKLEIPSNVPILIDDWLHPRFIESIDFFLKGERNLIKVGKYNRVLVEKLHFIDNFSYVPPMDRNFVLTGNPPIPDPTRFQFSSLGIELLQNEEEDSKKYVVDEGFQKLFLMRTDKTSGNKRQITNIVEIVEIARSHGYFVVDPAELSFEQQKALFRQARVVISPLGAAMVNLIFAPKGCKVMGLSPLFVNGDYHYFAILNSLLGHEFTYLLGNPLTKDGKNHNSNFKIDLGDFKSALDLFH